MSVLKNLTNPSVPASISNGKRCPKITAQSGRLTFQFTSDNAIFLYIYTHTRTNVFIYFDIVRLLSFIEKIHMEVHCYLGLQIFLNIQIQT